MSYREQSNIVKLLTILSLGLTEGIRAKVVSIDDAQQLLYSPRTMKLLRELGCSEELIDLVHLGTELEDIESLLPERLADNLLQMSDSAMDALRKMPMICSEQSEWYDEILKR